MGKGIQVGDDVWKAHGQGIEEYCSFYRSIKVGGHDIGGIHIGDKMPAYIAGPTQYKNFGPVFS
jgi:hypothetical protein